jgi:hypothetical protein
MRPNQKSDEGSPGSKLTSEQLKLPGNYFVLQPFLAHEFIVGLQGHPTARPAGNRRPQLFLRATALRKSLEGHLGSVDRGPRLTGRTQSARASKNRIWLRRSRMIGRVPDPLVPSFDRTMPFDFLKIRHSLPRGTTAQRFCPNLPMPIFELGLSLEN